MNLKRKAYFKVKVAYYQSTEYFGTEFVDSIHRVIEQALEKYVESGQAVSYDIQLTDHTYSKDT